MFMTVAVFPVKTPKRAYDSGNDFKIDVSPLASRPCKAYCVPEISCMGHAINVILERGKSKSKRAAEQIRRMIDESGGSLLFSAASECQELKVSLSLVSRQFKKLYQVTIRRYSRDVRMKNAEKLLKESKNLNIDETARVFGYSFTSAFSRCFQRTLGTPPKRYQMQYGATVQRETGEEAPKAGVESDV
jgi:AraC-like DNA-binding protein